HLGSWCLPLELHSVTSGFDALLRIGAARPDLLITDLRMPGIDGFEMIRALQASEAISDLEVIVVTALTQHTIAERGGLPDRITVLHKPLRFDQLRQRLLQLIARRQGLAAAG
ncbi:MAG: response regulator, partial [Steroidobacteraceae bacterium]